MYGVNVVEDVVDVDASETLEWLVCSVKRAEEKLERQGEEMDDVVESTDRQGEGRAGEEMERFLELSVGRAGQLSRLDIVRELYLFLGSQYVYIQVVMGFKVTH